MAEKDAASSEDPLETLVSTAETYLDTEDLERAAGDAAKALALARERSEDVQVARSLRVLIGVEILKEQFEAAENLASSELELFQELGCTWGEAAMLLSMAEIMAEWPGDDQSSARIADALQFALEALDLFRGMQDVDDGAWYMEGCVLLVLITIYHKQNKLAEVRSAASLALERFRELGDERNEGRALHGLALTHAMAGKTWDAVKTSQKALWLFRDLGVKRLEASECLALATWHVCDGDWRGVLEMAEESMTLFRKLSISSGEVAALDLFAKACCQLGESERALKETKDVLKRAQNAGVKRTEASLLEILAGAHLAQGSSKEAVLTTEKALGVAKTLKDEKWQAKLLYVLAQTHLEFEQWTDAWERAHEASDLSRKIGEKDLDAAIGLHVIVTLQLARNSPEDALDTARNSLKQYQRSGDEKGEAMALYIIGCIHSEMNDDKEATNILRKAQEMFQENCDYKMEANVCQSTAQTHLNNKRHKEALRLALEARMLSNKAKDPAMEVKMCIFATKCHLVMMESMAEPGKEARDAFGFQAEWEKALKVASGGKNLARKLGDPFLLAEALVILGDVALVQNKTKDAMSAGSEAVELSRTHDNKKGIAAAQVLRARILHIDGQMSEALAAAQEALQLYSDVGDEAGEDQAKMILTWLRQAGTVAAKETRAEDSEVVTEAASSAAAVVEDKGPAILDATVVQTTLDAILSGLIGNDVMLDEPFMDAGVDSLLGIQFRTEMQKNFGGLKLSSTIVFDYPNARQLIDHIVELSAAAIED